MYNIDVPFIKWKDLEKILDDYAPLFKDVATDYSKLRIKIKNRVEIPVNDIRFVREDGTVISICSGTIYGIKEI